jgi:hypothetical protein
VEAFRVANGQTLGWPGMLFFLSFKKEKKPSMTEGAEIKIIFKSRMAIMMQRKTK